MYRILLAEDNPGDVFLFREALRAHGLTCELIVAEDGEKALTLIEKAGTDGNRGNPDLIVLDINLPKRSGQEVLQSVRGNATFAKVPVVILTSSASPDDRSKATQAGADFYLHKSSNLDDFFQIGKIIEGLADGRATNQS